MESLQKKSNFNMSEWMVKYPQFGTGLLFVVLCIIFIIFSPTNKAGDNVFLTAQNWTSILESTAGFSIGAFAMALVLLTGGIDLSAGAVMAFTGMVVAKLMEHTSLPLPLIIVISLGLGLLSGLFNGFIIVRFKVPPFLATLGTAGILQGLGYMIADGKSVYVTNESFTRIFGFGQFLGVPMLAWWTLLFTIIMYLLISKTKFGRRAQAIGGNEEAAHNSGINVSAMKCAAYGIMGLVSAFVVLTTIGRLGSAVPTQGQGYELQFIVAAVLGGTGFSGQGGNVFSVLLGSLVLGVLLNGMTLVGVNYYLQAVIKGLVIIMAVIVTLQLSRKK